MTAKRKPSAILSPGQVLKELRLKKGWSQVTLAEISAMAVSNLSNIEHGRSRLGEDRAILLAEALGVRPEFLLFPNGYERQGLQAKLREVRRRLRKVKGDLAA